MPPALIMYEQLVVALSLRICSFVSQLEMSKLITFMVGRNYHSMSGSQEILPK